MRYVFNCPSCGFEFEVESETDKEAVEMLCEKFGVHMGETHPDMPPQKNINAVVQDGMKKSRVKALERNC